MVVGEPGIGKTSLCEQLATYAAVRGGRTLVGHCYEEGSLSVPYRPFIEALRSYVLAREPNDLEKELGPGAAEGPALRPDLRLPRFQLEVLGGGPALSHPPGRDPACPVRSQCRRLAAQRSKEGQAGRPRRISGGGIF